MGRALVIIFGLSVILIIALLYNQVFPTEVSNEKPPKKLSHNNTTSNNTGHNHTDHKHDHEVKHENHDHSKQIKINTAHAYGYVFDSKSVPVASATINFQTCKITEPHMAPSAPVVYSTKSGNDGSFKIDLPDGLFLLYVHTGAHRPYREESVKLLQGESRFFNVLLSETAKIEGVVLDINSRPIGGAHIGSSDESSLLVKTDELGRFTLHGIEEEKTNIFVIKKGYATRHMKGVPAWSFNTIILERPSIIKGFVQGSSSYTIKLAIGKQIVTSKQCNGSSFQIDEVSPGDYTIYAENENLVSKPLPIRVVSDIILDCGPLIMGEKK